MPRKNSADGTGMLACTLCRSGRQSIATLKRASLRKIEWPKVSSDPPHFRDTPTYSSIDDSFDTVMQFMNMTTRQCKRYFGCRSKDVKNDDGMHWQRFHTQNPLQPLNGNPLQKAEDVRLDMAPGTYAISAGRWGADRDHTHVVHVSPGQTIDLTFGV